MVSTLPERHTVPGRPWATGVTMMGSVSSTKDYEPRPDRAMPQITVNQQSHALSEPTTVADLLRQLGLDPRRVAVEVNRDVVPRIRHAEHRLTAGDAVEIVTLVGGGAPDPEPPADDPLVIGRFR